MVTSWQVKQRTKEPQEKYSLPLPAVTVGVAATGLGPTIDASDGTTPPTTAWPEADKVASDPDMAGVDATTSGDVADVGDESGVESCAFVGEDDGDSFLAIIFRRIYCPEDYNDLMG